MSSGTELKQRGWDSRPYTKEDVDRFLAKGGTPTIVNIYVHEHRLVQLKFEASGTESATVYTPNSVSPNVCITEIEPVKTNRHRGYQIELAQAIPARHDDD